MLTENKRMMIMVMPYIFIGILGVALYLQTRKANYYKTINKTLNEKVEEIKKDRKTKIENLRKEKEKVLSYIDSLDAERKLKLVKDETIVKDYNIRITELDTADWDTLHNVLSKRGLVQ